MTLPRLMITCVVMLFALTTGCGEPAGDPIVNVTQVRSTVHVGTFPYSRDSTAYAVDYALAWRRACYEGEFTWLNDPSRPGGYVKGDEWGCVGTWFSGGWYDGDENVPYSGAKAYIKGVKQHLANRTWTTPTFINGE